MSKTEYTPSPEPVGEKSPIETSPTIAAILQGGATIKYLSNHLETREVGSRLFQGRVYSYELKVPHPTKPGEKWLTELGVWFPAAYYPKFDERLDRKPEMQIDILTGQGHMQLTKDPVTLRKVYEEIRRQIDQGPEINPEG